MDSHDWDRRYDQDELVWSAEPNRFLVPEVADLAPGRALDVACGEGRNAIWLAEHGWEVTGVDFSPVAIGKAVRLAEARGVMATWRVQDVVTERLERHVFDLVLVFYLQLPQDQRRQFIADAAGALRPGGTLLVVAHERSNLEHGWGGPKDANVLYRPEDVVADLGGTLEIVKAERLERSVETDEGPKMAIDLIVRGLAVSGQPRARPSVVAESTT